jgi:hypothetical protein
MSAIEIALMPSVPLCFGLAQLRIRAATAHEQNQSAQEYRRSKKAKGQSLHFLTTFNHISLFQIQQPTSEAGSGVHAKYYYTTAQSACQPH